MDNTDRCFACNRKLGKHPQLADTRDAQLVHVGRECIKKIIAAGEAGYQPPLGGPRLYTVPAWVVEHERMEKWILSL
jgi:hypothetical protein